MSIDEFLRKHNFKALNVEYFMEDDRLVFEVTAITERGEAMVAPEFTPGTETRKDFDMLIDHIATA